ncbi:MAG: hypothetical protein A2586_02445 [Candidatus Harrisonbacteria bacterium RIFOXYD1_FULL_40_9]|uniref:Uncharacterized protein n=1 Tax=Candidatus Harrisonbacteria bacterium RIFOXYD1_FULL_40_9 TaxID=1798412 RepID=A0A1G1ZWK8_9BACT|nr:MAG: hypothetical protein A2586_02445 [Candidatus Harrisonbacteria bacterium RIFOXYD1_FULL_40_9]
MDGWLLPQHVLEFQTASRGSAYLVFIPTCLELNLENVLPGVISRACFAGGALSSCVGKMNPHNISPHAVGQENALTI